MKYILTALLFLTLSAQGQKKDSLKITAIDGPPVTYGTKGTVRPYGLGVTDNINWVSLLEDGTIEINGDTLAVIRLLFKKLDESGQRERALEKELKRSYLENKKIFAEVRKILDDVYGKKPKQ